MNTTNELSGCGLAACDTEINIFGPGALRGLAEVLAPHFGAGPFIIITDARIWSAVSDSFDTFLAARPDTTIYILPAHPQPYASDSLVAQIRSVLSASAAHPLAVGSGTINDVVKRAAFEIGRTYACLPTAPSVDGFTSFGAAITVKGFKVTLECPAPLCVIADEEIIARAPGDLIAAGYGDMLAKLTGGADWILADFMGIEAIDRAVWDMVQPAAVGLIDRGSAIARRDRDAIGILYRGLVASGLAMQRYKDSRPASGAEHLMSHTWEMSHLTKDGAEISHGFKVAIGTLISAAIMEELFDKNSAAAQKAAATGFAPDRDMRAKRIRRAQTFLASTAHEARTLEMIERKSPDRAEHERRCALAGAGWPELAARMAAQVPPFAILKKTLAEGGCPTEPADIGLTRDDCFRGPAIASLIRSRYTVLDLASELGVLDDAVESVFSGTRFSRYADKTAGKP